MRGVRPVYRCRRCGTEYRPRAHRPWTSYAVAALAIVAPLVVGWWLVREGETRLLVTKLVVTAALIVLALTADRWLREPDRSAPRPPVHDPSSGRPPAAGELVLECPACGGHDAAESPSVGASRPG